MLYKYNIYYKISFIIICNHCNHHQPPPLSPPPIPPQLLPLIPPPPPPPLPPPPLPPPLLPSQLPLTPRIHHTRSEKPCVTCSLV